MRGGLAGCQPYVRGCIENAGALCRGPVLAALVSGSPAGTSHLRSNALVGTVPDHRLTGVCCVRVACN